MQFLGREVELVEAKPLKVDYRINPKPRNINDIIIPVVVLRLLVSIGGYEEDLVFRAESETLYEEPILYCDRTGLVLSDLWHLKNLHSKDDVEEIQARFSNIFGESPSLKELTFLKAWLDNYTPSLYHFMETNPKRYAYYTKANPLVAKSYDELTLDSEVVSIVKR